MSLTNLGIPETVVKRLHAAGINTLENLRTKTQVDLLRIRGFGRRSLIDVCESLSTHDIYLEVGVDSQLDEKIQQKNKTIKELLLRNKELEGLYLLTMQTVSTDPMRKLAEQVGKSPESFKRATDFAKHQIYRLMREKEEEKEERIAIIANRVLHKKNAKLEIDNKELRDLLQEKQTGEKQLHGEDWVLMCCLVLNCSPDSIARLAPQFGLQVGERELIAIQKVNDLVVYWKERLDICDDPYKFTNEDLDRSIEKIRAEFASGRKRPFMDTEMIDALRKAALAVRTFEGARFEDTGDAAIRIMVAIATLMHRIETQ